MNQKKDAKDTKEKKEVKKQKTNLKEDDLKVKDIDKELTKEKEFVIDSETIEKKITEKIGSYKGKIKIKGFRKGNVPPGYVRNYFYDELMEEVKKDLINSKMKELIEKEKNIASYPKVSQSYDKEKGFKIKMRYEILPDIDLIDYSDIEVEDFDINPTKKEVDEEIEKLKRQTAEVIPVENEEITEDTVVDFEFQIKNPNTDKWMKKEKLENRKAGEQDYMNVKNMLLGLKIGEEKVFKGKIPERVDSESFAGKQTEARIKILEARKIKLPEINDDFAKSLGNYESFADLKKKIKDAIKEKKKENRKYILGERLIEKMEENMDFGVPSSYIFEEMNNLFKRGYKYDPATSLKVSRKNVKKMFILEKIAEKENIDVSKKDIDDYLQQQAKAYGVTVEMLKSQLDKEQFNEIKGFIKRKNIVELLGKKVIKKQDDSEEKAESAVKKKEKKSKEKQKTEDKVQKKEIEEKGE